MDSERKEVAMSVIIKGVEIPKNCWECPCVASDGYGWFCNLDDEYRDVCDGRPDWCPLVELPEHHGRLIDADKIDFNMTNAIYRRIAEETIAEAPTVLEAE